MARSSVCAFALALLFTAACGGHVNGGNAMDADDRAEADWRAVASADDAQAQAERLERFIAEHAKGTPLQVSVRRRDSGEKAAIDQALWSDPPAHEITVLVDRRPYVFTPLSRASLEPLFRE